MADTVTRTPAPPPRLSPDILHRNLDALRTVDEPLVRRIQAIDPAKSGWKLATTRDGQIGFQREGSESGIQWLGRSSVPNTRAEAILEQFDPGRANVLMPGIAEGSEAASLLRTLGCHRAVFVWEDDLTQLSLALRCHDIADAIRNERLVLLVCNAAEVAGRLLDWLRQHPGHLCPERLMMWPWQTLSQLAVLRSAVESAYRAIEQERQTELARVRALYTTASAPDPSGPVAILALHAREEIWSTAEGLADAAAAGGQPAIVGVLRGPADVHPLALAQKIAAHPCRPSRAFLLDVTRRSVRDVIGDELPAISWLSPLAGVPADLPDQIGPGDQVVVTTSHLRDEALACGVPQERLHVLPPACPAIVPTPDLPERSSQIALVADLASLDPEQHGIRLPTHVQLWRAVRDLIEARIDGFRADRIEPLLQQAEEKTGVALEETAIRRAFVSALRKAAQTLSCSFIVKSLRQTSLPLRVFGTGWTSPPADDANPVTLDRHLQIAQQSAVMIHVDVMGSRTAEALLAAGSGSLLFALATPFDDAPGGLATLLRPIDEYLPFRTVRGLTQLFEKLASVPDSDRIIAANAHARCRRDHTPARRLAALDAILTS